MLSIAAATTNWLRMSRKTLHCRTLVGDMNLMWVAALTAFVLVEKIGPFGLIVARVAGALMIVVGILVVAGVR